VGVHSLTLSYILGSMKCDFRASFLAHNFASPYFGCEPKARVVTLAMDNIDNMNYILKHDHVNDTNELNKMM